MEDRLRLRRDDTAVLVIDIQERLCAAMEPRALERVVARSRALLEGAAALGLPVALTEQYPKGLGPTVEPIRAALGERFLAHAKTEFTASLPPVLETIGKRGGVLVCGMETHVCVFQTVRDLAARGHVPHVCADAVISRFEEDRRVGLALCERAGAVLTTVEAALFDLLGCAGGPEFKRISAAVK
jgi:nicotinamidase-related amidase